MDDIIPTSKPQRTAADDVADAIIDAINAESKHQRAEHMRIWDMLWRHVDAKPADIIAALGERLPVVFEFSAENVRHLLAVAEKAGMTPEQFGIAGHIEVPEPFRG